MHIAFLLRQPSPEQSGAALSQVTAEIIDRLRDLGARVELLWPEAEALDLATIQPRHDLYVLKSKSPLCLSLAGALAATGARVVNSYASCALVRDKVAVTAVLAAAGVPVPPSWATGRPDRLWSLLTDGPVWWKPPRGSRGAGVRRLSDPIEFDGATEHVDPFGLPLPLFAQREVPSDGRDLKVFVVGDRLWATSRPWPARTLADKWGQPAELPAEIEAAARACGRILGLALYGVDFLVAADRFYAVDVNAFPGYKGAAGASRAIAEYLYARVA